MFPFLLNLNNKSSISYPPPSTSYIWRGVYRRGVGGGLGVTFSISENKHYRGRESDSNENA